MTSKDSQIIRQSQLKIALEYLRDQNIKPSVLELVVFTEALKDYVETGLTKENITRIKSVDEFVNNKK